MTVRWTVRAANDRSGIVPQESTPAISTIKIEMQPRGCVSILIYSPFGELYCFATKLLSKISFFAATQVTLFGDLFFICKILSIPMPLLTIFDKYNIISKNCWH